MNILHDRWIPVLHSNENVNLEQAKKMPIEKIQSGRPDFDFSILLIAIGQQQTGIDNPMLLSDEGPRFLQNHLAKKNGEEKPIGQLLLDEPSEFSIKRNTDIFIRGNRRNKMCSSCALMALYIQTQFCGPIGPGMYPGALYHTMLYIKKSRTLGKTISSNLIPQKIPKNAYFNSPNNYWLSAPGAIDNCHLCGKKAPVISSFWRGKNGKRPESSINPHVATTVKGKRYTVRPTDALINVIEGCAAHSAIAVQPLAIHQNAHTGDEIQSFGTFYKKGKLTRTTTDFFALQPPLDFYLIIQTINSIAKINSPRIKANNFFDSTFYGELIGKFSEDIILCHRNKKNDVKKYQWPEQGNIAIKIFNQYCPRPATKQKISVWENERKKIFCFIP